MANNNDGKNDYHKNLNSGGVDEAIKKMKSSVEYTGNADAKILAKAFEEFSKDGLTNKEREKIKLFDDLLKDADIIIDKEGTSATIVQEDGKSFNVKASKQIQK